LSEFILIYFVIIALAFLTVPYVIIFVGLFIYFVFLRDWVAKRFEATTFNKYEKICLGILDGTASLTMKIAVGLIICYSASWLIFSLR